MTERRIPPSPRPHDPERHARKCAICRSENRDAIEEAFLHGLSTTYITSQFSEIHDRMSLYRHAWATGLCYHRRRNLRAVVDLLVEKADGAQISGSCALRAIRAYSRLNKEGRWTEPVQKTVISREDNHLPISEGESILIVTQKTLETNVTPTKQTPESIPNRDKCANS